MDFLSWKQNRHGRQPLFQRPPYFPPEWMSSRSESYPVFLLILWTIFQVSYLVWHRRKAAPGSTLLLGVLLHLLLVPKHPTLSSKADMGGESGEEACQARIRVFIAPSRHLHLLHLTLKFQHFLLQHLVFGRAIKPLLEALGYALKGQEIDLNWSRAVGGTIFGSFQGHWPRGVYSSLFPYIHIYV